LIWTASSTARSDKNPVKLKKHAGLGFLKKHVFQPD